MLFGTKISLYIWKRTIPTRTLELAIPTRIWELTFTTSALKLAIPSRISELIIPADTWNLNNP